MVGQVVAERYSMLQSPRQYRVVSFSASAQLHLASARKGAKSPNGKIRLRNLPRSVSLQSPKFPHLLQGQRKPRILRLPQAMGGSSEGGFGPTATIHQEMNKEAKHETSRQNNRRTRQLTAGGGCFLSKGFTRQADGISSFCVSLVKDRTVFSTSLVE